MAEAVSAEDKTQGMLAHILNILFPAVGALVIWLIGKDKSKFVDTEGKEALNWGITVLGAYIVGWVLTATLIGAIIGIPVLLAAGIAALVFGIMGGMAANKGENYTYKVAVRLIK